MILWILVWQEFVGANVIDHVEVGQDCFNTSYAVNHPPIGQPLKKLNFDESLVQGYMRAGVGGLVQDLSGETI